MGASSFKSLLPESDELLLSGWLLSAFEFGHLRMNAGDYLDVAVRARAILDECPVATLLRMRRDGPRALRDIIEAALIERGVFDRPTHDPGRVQAMRTCEALLLKLSLWPDGDSPTSTD
jgi:hypothetical protein